MLREHGLVQAPRGDTQSVDALIRGRLKAGRRQEKQCKAGGISASSGFFPAGASASSRIHPDLPTPQTSHQPCGDCSLTVDNITRQPYQDIPTHHTKCAKGMSCKAWLRASQHRMPALTRHRNKQRLTPNTTCKRQDDLLVGQHRMPRSTRHEECAWNDCTIGRVPSFRVIAATRLFT